LRSSAASGDPAQVSRLTTPGEILYLPRLQYHRRLPLPPPLLLLLLLLVVLMRREDGRNGCCALAAVEMASLD